MTYADVIAVVLILHIIQLGSLNGVKDDPLVEQTVGVQTDRITHIVFLKLSGLYITKWY